MISPSETVEAASSAIYINNKVIYSDSTLYIPENTDLKNSENGSGLIVTRVRMW
jgi:hypothetical protein